jgi:dipeptidase D
MTSIKDLHPANVWNAFHALTQVPRPSGHLEKAHQFLLEWAKEHNIEAFKDGGDNIVFRKPATPGLEGKKTAVLQAHIDMVPQAVKGSTHNFETDPIETYIDGDWVKAKGTTLGSDDGIGVAMIMAIFADDTLKHGPLEALITADEETCMWGVNHLSPDTLKGDILLNIDNEKEGEFVIGSAGGVNVTGSLQYKEVAPDEGDVALKVALKGLRGGHSGLEINQGRGNANKLMARFLAAAIADDEARLASWHGGNMRNAIPRDAEVIITVPAGNEDDVKDLAAYCEKLFNEEFVGIESDIRLEVSAADMPAGELPEEIQDNLVDAVYACHDGVLRYIPSIPSVVETSSNLAIVDIEGGNASVKCLVRSSADSMKEYQVSMIECCFNMAGMKVETDGDYMAWQPNFESPIVAQIKELYQRRFNTPADVQVCHAGLECSLIGKVYPEMDLVSMGPTLKSPHTPDERCYIPSVEKFYGFLCQLLAEIPQK